jgi:trimeric autotransporter adhesin
MPVSCSMRSVRAHAFVIIALAALSACKEAAEPPRAAEVVGLPPVDSVRIGKSVGWDIALRDAEGNPITGRRITWTSLNPHFATVNDNGLVTGVAFGHTVITARADDAVATSTVFVQEPVASVVLFPSTPIIPVGGTQALTVAVSDRNGIALPGRTVEFSSSNTSVATVNSSGVVVAVAEGQATITGRAVQDGISGSAAVNVVRVSVNSVTISPAGAQTVFQGNTLQLSATLRDGNNNILTGRQVNWTTSNPSAATVSGTGLVTGVGLGNTQITAESEGRTGTVSVGVAPRPVATVSLSPNPGAVQVGSALQMTLDLRDANGAPLTTVGRTVLWESSNRPVATVQDGVVIGVSVGTAVITVTVDLKPATATITVLPK